MHVCAYVHVYITFIMAANRNQTVMIISNLLIVTPILIMITDAVDDDRAVKTNILMSKLAQLSTLKRN